MGEALGMSTQSGGRFPRFINGKAIAKYIGPELKEKLDKPLVFQASASVPNLGMTLEKVHGFDVTLLIEVCECAEKAVEVASKSLCHSRFRRLLHRDLTSIASHQHLGLRQN